MADTKTAKQQNKKEWEEANWSGKDVSATLKPEEAGKDAGRGSNGKDGKNGKDGSSASASGSGSDSSKTAGGGRGLTVDEHNRLLRKELEKSIENGKKVLDRTNTENAEKKDFNFDTGRTKSGYVNRDVLNKEKEQAKNALEKAKQGNEKYQGLLKGSDLIQGIFDKYNKGFKKGDDKLNPEELRAQAEKEGAEAEYYKNLSETGDDGETIWSWDKSLGTNKDWAKMADNLEKNKADILEQAQRGEDFQKLKPQLDEFAQKMGSLLGYQVDEHGKWAAVEGSQTNKYQAEIAQNLFDKINKIYEDGQVTQDEMEVMGTIFDDIDKLAEEEYRSDKNIQKAEDQYNSAKAKSTYFLLDQIKTWAAFLIGLSQGNPTMVYSAMEQFNKKIADAEAGFTENRIGAFSNNDVKGITSPADAQYTVEQLIPALDKAIIDGKLKINERAQAVEALEMAFEEYQNYVGQGGKEDFAVWFASQNVNSNGWFGIIQTLLNSGALNWDMIKDAVMGSKDAKPTPSGKKGAMLDPKSVIDTSGIVSGLAQGLLQNSKTQGDEITRLKNKQGAVNDALASRGQGLALQGNGTASPVNKSWGRG